MPFCTFLARLGEHEKKDTCCNFPPARCIGKVEAGMAKARERSPAYKDWLRRIRPFALFVRKVGGARAAFAVSRTRIWGMYRFYHLSNGQSVRWRQN